MYVETQDITLVTLSCGLWKSPVWLVCWRQCLQGQGLIQLAALLFDYSSLVSLIKAEGTGGVFALLKLTRGHIPSYDSCPPPPTKNALKADERTRLVRSSRKIQALLGETPHFVENPPPTLDVLNASSRHSMYPRHAVLHKRVMSEERGAARMRLSHQAAQHSHSPSMVQQPAVMAVQKSKHCSSALPPVSRPLLLLHVLSREANPPHTLDTALNLGPSFLDLVAAWSPPSSPTANESPGYVRRKKMDRVVRRLGETVPPDLVFPSDRGRSLESMQSVSAPIPNFQTRVMTNSVDGRLVPPSSTTPRKCTYDRRRSCVGFPALQYPETPTLPLRFERAASPKPQAGWNGEWNENMDEVIKRLRNLKH
ncbi:hypothetical protein FB451DRAFT_1161432 [Mycena latifolia]|nr:hypothetical protein FB451DRAFT_1161432 [Mycena latifolia]